MRRSLSLRDWPFGAVGRRLLLETLLSGDQPLEGWSKKALEGRAKVGPGGLDEVLAGAVQLGLVRLSDGRWHRPEVLPKIASPLTALTRAMTEVPETPIKPFQRRPYRSSR